MPNIRTIPANIYIISICIYVYIYICIYIYILRILHIHIHYVHNGARLCGHGVFGKV